MSYADIASKGPHQSASEAAAPPLPQVAHDDIPAGAVHTTAPESMNATNQIPSYADQQKEAEEAARKRARETSKNVQDTTQDAKKGAQEFGRQAEKDAERLKREGGKAVDHAAEAAKGGVQEVKKNASKLADQASEGFEDVADSVEKNTRGLREEANKDYRKVKSEASKDFKVVKEEAKDMAKDIKQEASSDAKEVERKAKQAEVWAEKNKGNPVVQTNMVVLVGLAALLGTGAYRQQQAGTLTWKVAGAWAGVVGLFGLGDYYVSQYVTLSGDIEWHDVLTYVVDTSSRSTQPNRLCRVRKVLRRTCRLGLRIAQHSGRPATDLTLASCGTRMLLWRILTQLRGV